MAGSMFDAYYEAESRRIREAAAEIEAELFHEKPVSAKHDPRQRRGGRPGRSRAVFAQTEFSPDMAEWHLPPWLEPSMRVRGTAIDLEAARVRFLLVCTVNNFCQLPGCLVLL